MAYAARILKEDGHTLVELQAGSHTARIAADLGANWYSWVVDGTELLAASDIKSGRLTGTPVLFPTPNRVWNAAYQFDGKIVHQRKHGRPHVLHGLVGNDPFAVEALTAQEDGAQAVLSIGITEGENLESYPWPCRLTMTYTLTEKGMCVAYRVENLGEETLPFGFAIHPFFALLGSRKDIQIQVPAPLVHVSSPEHFPTGEVFPVEGTRFDLRTPQVVEGLVLDDVYFGMDAGKTASIHWTALGRKVELTATDDFDHMVVYTPADTPVVCLENQTCSTDAVNRHNAGFVETAHLLTVAPGESFGGSIQLVHSYTK